MEPRTIQVNGVRVNALAGVGSRLLCSAYAHFDRMREQRSDGMQLEVEGWKLSPSIWRNVQLLSGTSEDGALAGVFIPGTNELADWTAGNLNCIPTRLAGCPGLWRRGFVIPGDLAAIRLLALASAHPAAALMIAGHSYGGAAATVAAACVARSGLADRLIAVLDFAGPRACSGSGSDYLTELLGEHVGQRFSFGLDVVPWSVAPGLWKTALENIFVASDGRVRKRMGFWRELTSSLRRQGLNPIGDHSISRYAEWATSIQDG